MIRVNKGVKAIKESITSMNHIGFFKVYKAITVSMCISYMDNIQFILIHVQMHILGISNNWQSNIWGRWCFHIKCLD